MTVQPIEYERPTWRDVSIDLLAGKLRQAFMAAPIGELWTTMAEAAVDMLIDEPEREFQSQLQAVLGEEVTESRAAREWREAKASDWLPEHA